MSSSQFFVVLTISFLAGVLLASMWPVPQWLIGCAVGLGVVDLCAELFQSHRHRHKWSVIGAAALLLFCGGILRFQLAVKPGQFSNVLNQKREWEGLVVADADIRLQSRQVTVLLDGFNQNILVVTASGTDVTYGDRVWLTGTLVEADSFDDFDYGNYLKRFNVYALMRRPKLVVVARHKGNPVKALLFNAKNFLVNRCNAFIAEPKSSLLIGILIGARKTVPAEIVEQFNRTGLSHIVAVSGYNISIIIVSLGFLSKYVGRRLSFIISSVIIIGFVVMTGASASIVRAGIMGMLMLIASMIGRPYAITPSLVFSAALMVFLNPRILYTDKGFQLSFAATAGIVYVLPWLEAWFEWVPNWLELKSILLTTFSATWFTWPLLVGGFGRVSVVAPLANLLILPLIPWLMLFGFCVLLPGIGAGFAYLSNLMLIYILKALAHLSAWSLASISLAPSTALFCAALAMSCTAYALLHILSYKRGIKL